MTCMLVLSGRVELMVMHGGVKNNYDHNVVVMNLPLCPQTADDVMHQSIPSANIPPGKFFEVVKSPAPGQNFPAKARPPGQGNTYPRGVF